MEITHLMMLTEKKERETAYGRERVGGKFYLEDIGNCRLRTKLWRK